MNRTLPALLVPLASLALLTGCGGNSSSSSSTAASTAPAAGASSEPADPGSVSFTPSAAPSVETSSLKKAATAKLPAKLDGMTGQVSASGGVQSAMYTGGSQDDMLMASIDPKLTSAAALKDVNRPVRHDHAWCGTVQTTTAAICLVPLDGGTLTLTGTDQTKPERIAALANELYNSFA